MTDSGPTSPRRRTAPRPRSHGAERARPDRPVRRPPRQAARSNPRRARGRGHQRVRGGKQAALDPSRTDARRTRPVQPDSDGHGDCRPPAVAGRPRAGRSDPRRRDLPLPFAALITLASRCRIVPVVPYQPKESHSLSRFCGPLALAGQARTESSAAIATARRVRFANDNCRIRAHKGCFTTPTNVRVVDRNRCRSRGLACHGPDHLTNAPVAISLPTRTRRRRSAPTSVGPTVD